MRTQEHKRSVKNGA